MENHISHNNFHQNADNRNLRLYHKDVFFPERLMDICKRFISNINPRTIILSHHIMDSIYRNDDGDSHEYSEEDVTGAIEMAVSAVKKGRNLNIFEAGFSVHDDKILLEKVVFRQPLDSDVDISVVVTRNDGRPKAITAWINEHNDNHKEGFNSNRYYRPKDFDVSGKDVIPPAPKKKVVIVRRKKTEESMIKTFKRIFEASNYKNYPVEIDVTLSVPAEINADTFMKKAEEDLCDMFKEGCKCKSSDTGNAEYEPEKFYHVNYKLEANVVAKAGLKYEDLQLDTFSNRLENYIPRLLTSLYKDELDTLSDAYKPYEHKIYMHHLSVSEPKKD